MQNFKTKTFKLNEVSKLTANSAKLLKRQLLESSSKCPLCGNEIKKPVLDHQHMTNSETIGENGAGLVRGVICDQCNAFLGKIENNSKRFGIQNLPEFLINVAKYLENPNLPYIHPNETKRLKEKCMKSDYNKFVKFYASNKNIDLNMVKAKFKYSKFYNKNLEILRDFYILNSNI